MSHTAQPSPQPSPPYFGHLKRAAWSAWLSQVIGVIVVLGGLVALGTSWWPGRSSFMPGSTMPDLLGVAVAVGLGAAACRFHSWLSHELPLPAPSKAVAVPLKVLEDGVQVRERRIPWSQLADADFTLEGIELRLDDGETIEVATCRMPFVPEPWGVFPELARQRHAAALALLSYNQQWVEHLLSARDAHFERIQGAYRGSRYRVREPRPVAHPTPDVPSPDGAAREWGDEIRQPIRAGEAR